MLLFALAYQGRNFLFLFLGELKNQKALLKSIDNSLLGQGVSAHQILSDQLTLYMEVSIETSIPYSNQGSRLFLPPGFSDLPTALLSTSYGFPTNFCFFLLYPSHDLGQNSDYFDIHYLLIEIT